MTIVVAVVLALAAIGFVGYPLLREPEQAKPRLAKDDADEIKARREMLRDAVAELESERQMGKLSEDDYQTMLNEYSRNEAALSEIAARPRVLGNGYRGKQAGNDRKRGKSRSKR